MVKNTFPEVPAGNALVSFCLVPSSARTRWFWRPGMLPMPVTSPAQVRSLFSPLLHTGGGCKVERSGAF